MDETSQETLCSSCAHARVCNFTKRYIEVQKRINEVVKGNFDFIDHVDALCNFYLKNTFEKKDQYVAYNNTRCVE